MENNIKTPKKSKSKEQKESLESSMKVFISNKMKDMGLNFDESFVDSVYKQMC